MFDNTTIDMFEKTEDRFHEVILYTTHEIQEESELSRKEFILLSRFTTIDRLPRP